MSKTKLTKLAEELNIDFLTAMTIVEQTVPEDDVTGKGKNTWLTESAVRALKDELEVPEIIPNYLVGKVTHQAPNPNYVYAYIREIDKRVPVIVARRFMGKLQGKEIKIEEIKDNEGSSYRYVPTRYNS